MTHIIFLMSDTGGGHRAACRAMEAALNARYPGQFTSELVDVWKDYTPFPFSTMPAVYAPWVNHSPGTYEAQYWVNDRIFRNRAVSAVYCRQMLPSMKRLYDEHPGDLIVCAHSVFVRPAVYALRRLGLAMPFVTVIADYAWPPVLWYDPRVDRCLVPTDAAYQRGLRVGMPPEKMVITGAPVHPKYTDLTLSKAEARAALGWSAEARIVLMVGGGDGMGPVASTARAIDRRELPIELMIVAGRNEKLKATLEAHPWQRPTRIYGFVDNLQVLMRAADLLITKAGPATITEAATVGVPMILSAAIRHQESPNAEYVEQNGAGVYAPGPRRVAESVAHLMTGDGAELQRMAEGARKLAQPDSIWKIVGEIKAYA